MANRLILRSKNSPFTGQFQDINKGSVLSHGELDDNFIYLKSNIIYTAETSGNILKLFKVDGTTIDVEIPVGSGTTSGDTFIETGYTIGNTIVLERNDGVDIEIPFPSSSGDTFLTGGTFSNDDYNLTLTLNNGDDINVSFSGLLDNTQFALNVDPRIYADGEPGSVDPLNRTGWYYKKEATDNANKINWYFYDNAPTADETLSDFDNAYSVIQFNTATTEMPFIIVYTKRQNDGSDAGTFYRSRLVYSNDTGFTPNILFRYLMYAGSDPNIELGLDRIPLTLDPFSSVGPQDPSEQILTISLSTNSAAVEGSYRLLASKFGYQTKQRTQIILHAIEASGGTGGDTYIETGYTIDNTLVLERNDGVDIEIDLPEITGSTGCPSGLTIYDEGILVDTEVCKINFIGDDVRALQNGDGQVDVYIPAPSFASHWNTSDGTTDGIVDENDLDRTIARMSTPNVSEGNPFYIGTWAETNQQATLEDEFIFTSNEDVTGFGGDSTMTIDIYAGDDTLIQSYTTPEITGNTTFNSGNITVEIINFALDTLKFKCKPIITVDVGSEFPSGSKIKIEIIHTSDTTTDGGATYTYTQDYVFYDDNPTTPEINGVVVIEETSGQILTKHISGIEYYILNSDFTIQVTDIDDLNENSQATGDTLTLSATDYGVSNITPEPFNTLSANFSGWTNDNNNVNTGFNYEDWSIDDVNYRFRDDDAKAEATPRDQWNTGTTQSSANNSILIDTYTDNSTDLNETFNGESKRYTDSGYTTSWDSTVTLVDGDALVMGGQLMIPAYGTTYNGSSNTGVNTNWSTYKPDLNGVNPNYNLLINPSSFYRKFEYGDAISDLNNFRMTFTGTFAGGNALTDLINEDLQIFIRKINSNDGTALIGTSAPANNLHGTAYNFATYDQGTTDGQIRTGTNTNNNDITATFGAWPASEGFYCEIKINNSAIKLSSVLVTFNG